MAFKVLCDLSPVSSLTFVCLKLYTQKQFSAFSFLVTIRIIEKSEDTNSKLKLLKQIPMPDCRKESHQVSYNFLYIKKFLAPEPYINTTIIIIFKKLHHNQCHHRTTPYPLRSTPGKLPSHTLTLNTHEVSYLTLGPLLMLPSENCLPYLT